MKPQPVIVNFIPENGLLQIWVGNECLSIDGFLKGHIEKNPNLEAHSRVFTEEMQKTIIRKLIDNLM